MKFMADDPVRLRNDRVSQAGGTQSTFSVGSVGRVCKSYASGFYCVQFPNRCLRIREDFLEATSEPAPDCSDSCRSGC